MPQRALRLIQPTEQNVALQMPCVTEIQHAGHAGFQRVAAADDALNQLRLAMCQRSVRQSAERGLQRQLGLLQPG
ncbi:hypothetical protein D3C75_1056680 [compost metagenome]